LFLLCDMSWLASNTFSSCIASTSKTEDLYTVFLWTECLVSESYFGIYHGFFDKCALWCACSNFRVNKSHRSQNHFEKSKSYICCMSNMTASLFFVFKYTQ
jgi:hypothetical protein